MIMGNAFFCIALAKVKDARTSIKDEAKKIRALVLLPRRKIVSHA
jgi:hypothetical protein